MAEWNRATYINNVYYLIQKNGFNIGELEEQSGVSAGYLARMKKGNEKISTEFFVRSANLLKANMETLVSIDLTQEPEDIRFAIETLDKLILKIPEQNWEIEDGGNKLLDTGYHETDYFSNPLLCNYKDTNSSTTLKSLNSIYHQDEYCCPSNPMYSIAINKFSFLVITAPIIDNNLEFELYLMSNDTLKPICHTGDNELINTKLSQIYEIISAKIFNEQNPHKLTSTEKEALTSFLD